MSALLLILAKHAGSMLVNVLKAKGQPGAAKVVESIEPATRAIIDELKQRAVEETGDPNAAVALHEAVIAAMREVDGLRADAEASLLRRASD